MSVICIGNWRMAILYCPAEMPASPIAFCCFFNACSCCFRALMNGAASADTPNCAAFISSSSARVFPMESACCFRLATKSRPAFAAFCFASASAIAARPSSVSAACCRRSWLVVDSMIAPRRKNSLSGTSPKAHALSSSSVALRKLAIFEIVGSMALAILLKLVFDLSVSCFWRCNARFISSVCAVARLSASASDCRPAPVCWLWFFSSASDRTALSTCETSTPNVNPATLSAMFSPHMKKAPVGAYFYFL